MLEKKHSEVLSSVVISNTHKRTTARLTLALLVIGVGALSSFLILGAVFGAHPVQKETTSVQNVTTIARAAPHVYGLPVRLSIPKINVDAAITYMGLTQSGNMEAPKTNEDAGWYKYGPHPGNVGSAVIAGHLGVGSHAVFTQLSSLVKGDTVSVTDDRGQTVSFVVTHMQSYANDTEPSEVFTSATGIHLNLITCNGEWNASRRTYSERLVVFADKV